MQLYISPLLLLAITALLTSPKPLTLQPPGEPSECALSLITLSPCLSYIAGPPNHAVSAHSVICCGTFYQTIMTAGPACVCYLVRDPLILGFPIDTGRLVAMFTSCKVNNPATAVHWLYDTCRGINPGPTPYFSYIAGPPNRVASAPSVMRTTYPPATTAQLTSSKPLTLRSPGEPSECALSLIALSPCLSYIAGPSNRAASAHSIICCGTFYQTIMTAGPACMCYLVQDPLILGFPIDTGRLVAMFPSCKVNNPATAVHWLYDTCRGINPGPTPYFSYIASPPNRVASAPSVMRTTYPPATTAQLTSSKPLTLRSPGEPSECALSLIALSPCLSYIAGPSNRAASAHSIICCGTFYQTIMTAGPACMCYLVQDPLILGFPIDTGRLVAMFTSCEVNNTATDWLYDTCRGINPGPTPYFSYIAGPPNRVASAPSVMRTTYPPATTAQLTSSKPLTLRSPGEPSECALSLIALSPCLSYIADPPNRAASAPSDICCGTFYQTIMTAGPACVCYLVRDPLILGFPIDTRRLVAMFTSCEVNNTATDWLYDTCRASSLPSIAPLPAVAESTTRPACPYLRWCRRLHSKKLQYAVYGLLLATNSLNWVLIIRYDVDNKGQSYMYFISLIISSIPVFLIPSQHLDTWEYIKLGTAIVCTTISIVADIAVYRHFGHLRVGLGFALGEFIGATVVRILGVKTAYLVQIISSVTNLASILILIVCILCIARWDYVPLEVLSAFLSAAYTTLDMIYLCDTPNTVLLGVAVLTRILYAILLFFRSHTWDTLLGWFYPSNVAQEATNGGGTRRLRPWGAIWRSLIEAYATPIRNLVQKTWNSLWELLKKSWNSFLERAWILALSRSTKLHGNSCGVLVESVSSALTQNLS